MPVPSPPFVSSPPGNRPDNRVRFELMGLERVRIALVRGFDIPRGPMREDALDWVKEQEDRRERRHHITMVATIAAAIGAWLVGKKRRQIWRGDVRHDPA